MAGLGIVMSDGTRIAKNREKGRARGGTSSTAKKLAATSGAAKRCLDHGGSIEYELESPILPFRINYRYKTQGIFKGE